MYKSKILREHLKKLKEKELYEPLRNIFIARGYTARINHGSHEKGKDIVAINDRENILISVKRGDIDSKKWKKDVHPSLEIMIKTPISQVHINENLPKKLILIFNGDLEPKVAEELKHINDFNRKHKEPIIEYWDINRLAQEIDRNLLEEIQQYI